MHVANIIRKYQGLCPNHPAATVCPSKSDTRLVIVPAICFVVILMTVLILPYTGKYSLIALIPMEG